MLPIHYLRHKHVLNALRFALLVLMTFYLLPALAQTTSTDTGTTGTATAVTTTAANNYSTMSAETMLVNMATQLPNLMRMVTAIAYVMGMIFIIRGIVKLKHMGESRTMMSQEHSITGPIAYILVGAALLYLPSTVQVGMSTFWTDPNPYGYVSQSDQWSQFFNVCFSIVQFVGVIAVIRGLVVLSHIGAQSHQGGVKTGITHIIGGIFCINIYQFVQVILNTLGIQT